MWIDALRRQDEMKETCQDSHEKQLCVLDDVWEQPLFNRCGDETSLLAFLRRLRREILGKGSEEHLFNRCVDIIAWRGTGSEEWPNQMAWRRQERSGQGGRRSSMAGNLWCHGCSCCFELRM